jgi:hypothetical protein
MIRSDPLGSSADHVARKHACSARLVSILYPRQDLIRSPRRCRLLWLVAIILLFPLRDFGQQSSIPRHPISQDGRLYLSIPAAMLAMSYEIRKMRSEPTHGSDWHFWQYASYPGLPILPPVLE